jgi:hypothetical protein
MITKHLNIFPVMAGEKDGFPSFLQGNEQLALTGDALIGTGL